MNGNKVFRVFGLICIFFFQFTVFAPVMSVHAAGDCTWTGNGVTSDVADPGNWTNCGGGTPDATSTATVPAGTPRSPVVMNTTTFASLTVQSGATINVGAGGTLMVNGNVANGGDITIAASRTMTVTGGTFTHNAGGTISGAGTLAVSGSNIVLNADLTNNVAALRLRSVNLTAGTRTLTNSVGRILVVEPNEATGGSGMDMGTGGLFNDGTFIARGWVIITGTFENRVGGVIWIEPNEATGGSGMDIRTIKNQGEIRFGDSGLVKAPRTRSPRAAQVLTLSSNNPIQNGSSATMNIAQAVDDTAIINASVVNTGTLNVSNNLRLRKDFTNDNGVLNQSAGTITFDGTAKQTIDSKTSLTFLNLEIANAANVESASDAQVNGSLALTNGDLQMKGATLTLASAATTSGIGDVVGAVRRNHAFTPGTNYSFGNPNVLLNFASITAGGARTVISTLAKTKPAAFTNAIARTYTIAASDISAYDATLRLRYTDAEVTSAGETEANLRLWRYDSGAGRYVLRGGTLDLANNFLSLSNVTAFSDWAIASSGAPTAVTLAAFTANAEDANDVSLLIVVGALAIVMVGLFITRRK